MDANTRQAIIQNHIKFVLSVFGMDKKLYDIWETSTQINVEANWIGNAQMEFIDVLAQRLGAKGYDVDVYKDGDTVIIDDAEIEEE
jgi:hypothetical protein